MQEKQIHIRYIFGTEDPTIVEFYSFLEENTTSIPTLKNRIELLETQILFCYRSLAEYLWSLLAYNYRKR